LLKKLNKNNKTVFCKKLAVKNYFGPWPEAAHGLLLRAGRAVRQVVGAAHFAAQLFVAHGLQAGSTPTPVAVRSKSEGSPRQSPRQNRPTPSD
jgi:hypothetical protein